MGLNFLAIKYGFWGRVNSIKEAIKRILEN